MKFYIYTLGCKVNTYESRVMADLLINSGYEEVENEKEADILIVNTCSVTNNADRKSAKTIRKMAKEQKILVVTGCFSQVSKQEVLEIEGVSIVLGNKNKTKIVSYIEEYQKEKKKQDRVERLKQVPFEKMKLNNFNKTRAFVKIEDGCNNFCSYCIIPFTRGNVRSKKREEVLEEVETLVKNGHKEIVLTGIHTGNYKVENYDFASLLEEIVQIKGLERLRISSIEMNEINDRVLKVIEKSSILVDHMHIPLQSGSDKILKEMNRKYNKEDFIQKIETIRKIRPCMSITTDVIVGFPKEGKKEFEETIETIKKIEFSKLHVFPYSKRKGTKAAAIKEQVDENTKKERAHILLNLSKELEQKYMEKYIGKEVTFIPEVWKENYLIGHTQNYLLVKAKGKKQELNKDIKVKITEINYPYEIGER